MRPIPFLQGLRQGFAAVVFGILLLLTLGTAGCGGDGSGGGGTTGDTTTGEVAIGLTDADGDFLTYSVDVVSITLTKANGAVVETLPLSTRVDFAQLVEMTEFVTAAIIPSGVYTSARLRLDYSNADIQVEKDGAATAANVVDANGQPITTLEVSVRLDDLGALTIVPGVPAHLTLDFDLKLSNEVDLAAAPPTVTVKPFLIADVEPEQPKIHRARGPLRSVNVAASSFQIGLRPFHLPHGHFGVLTVVTDGDTQFEINGNPFTGADGLTQLAGQPVATATVAVGDLDVPTRRFVAREVYAGSSVPWGTSDALTGNVVARSGDTLTVRGATLLRMDGSFTFRDTVTLLVGDATLVTRPAMPVAGLDKLSVSIGQRVIAFGTLTGDVGAQTLDATGGLVQLHMTTLTGHANAVAGAETEMNLQTIDGRRIALYDFSGTGASDAQDADPAHYQLATGSLDTGGLASGTPLRVRGYPRRFGQAPADFDAQTLINVTAAPATLLMNWQPAAAAPFTSLSDTGAMLNRSGAGLWHHVWRGGVATDLLGAPVDPTVTPRYATGLYAIGRSGTVQLYTRFADYAAALAAELAGGHAGVAVAARGEYTDATTTLAAGRMFTALQ